MIEVTAGVLIGWGTEAARGGGAGGGGGGGDDIGDKMVLTYRMRVETGAESGVKIINAIHSATIKHANLQRSNEQEQNICQGMWGYWFFCALTMGQIIFPSTWTQTFVTRGFI